MIVRVMGQGQWILPDEAVRRLNVLDELVVEAVGSRDGEALSALLEEMAGLVKSVGTPLPPGEVAISDLIVPDAKASVGEIAEWLQESRSGDGLIPG